MKRLILFLFLVAASVLAVTEMAYKGDYGMMPVDSLRLTNQFLSVVSSFTGPTNSLDLSKFRQEYTTTTAMAVTNFSNGAAAGFENSVVLSVTNSSGSDVILYITATGVTTDDGLRSYTITNGSQRKFSFNRDGMGYHCVARTFL